MKRKPITLIKLGGSVITNKEVPMSMKTRLLTSLIKQVKRAAAEMPGKQIMVGHGQGSFAHVPAAKYGTIKGFINDKSVLGMAVVQDAAAQLNRTVVGEFIRNKVPAVTFAASNVVITADHKQQQNFFHLLETYLEKGLFPVTYGDVIVDTKRGCTIWSTEEILAFLAGMFVKKGYKIDSIVHVTEVAGFLDEKKQIVPKITKKNWPALKKHLYKTKGIDVTGGMTLKIEESLRLAAKGIPSVILSGEKRNNLYHYLVGKKWVGTKIG